MEPCSSDRTQHKRVTKTTLCKETKQKRQCKRGERERGGGKTAVGYRVCVDFSVVVSELEVVQQ